MAHTHPTNPGLHVAIIMDGNGRWALKRGLSRTAGHAEGVNAVRRVVEAAPGFDIGTLSLFAFSADNWRRPRAEVRGILGLMRRYLEDETPRCVAEGVRLTVFGRQEGLDAHLRQAISRAQDATKAGEVLWLRIAVNYSSRAAILDAAAKVRFGRIRSRHAFSGLLTDRNGTVTPDVDLLIRTGGEKRLSDFLLWESAYAELYFTACMWPDFSAADLAEAIRDFRRRERRYGALTDSTTTGKPHTFVASAPVPAEESWLR